MSGPRACLSCRTAKVKCDLVRPSCGRCVRRGFVCSGAPGDGDSIFRDENEAARRNSERARRTPRQSGIAPMPLDVQALLGPQQQLDDASADSTTLSVLLRQQYTWLNDRALAEVPGPLKRDLCIRAVERFFVNWTLHPSNSGWSPGNMQYLPELYYNSSPDSTLFLTVRAVAFADMKQLRDGDTPFYVKALRNYGAALTGMRAFTESGQTSADDSTLAALLLIDNFESMYLARTEPLGPHDSALRYILRASGDEPLYNRSRFELWYVAHHRLQARQILLREMPDADQIGWMSKLNIDRPDIRISVDVLNMTTLCAEAKDLTEKSDDAGDPTAQVGLARDLVSRIRDLVASIESWSPATFAVWKPEDLEFSQLRQRHDVHPLNDLPISHLHCPRVLSYHDNWIAHMWNFHEASQIVLRESLVDTIIYIARLQRQEPPPADRECIQNQEKAVQRLSGHLIQSSPPLLGLIDAPDAEPGFDPISNGRMAGRFFSLFSMLVVQRAALTPEPHKRAAVEVTEWLNANHGLG